MPDATRQRATEAAAKDSTEAEILDARARIEFEIPTSKGDLTEAAKSAPKAPAGKQNTPGSHAPGRTMDNEEVRARMAGINLGPEATARANHLLGHLFEQGAAYGIRDEIDDATAARIAGQARGANHLGHPHREVIEARSVRQIPNFGEAPRDALVPVPARVPTNDLAVRGGGVVPVEPQAPCTALTVQERLPGFVSNDVRWLTIAQTPRYPQQLIRAFGRRIFRGFPCFAEHERQAQETGEPDPLATIHLLANIRGQGPSTERELDIVATWIRQNGTVIRSEELEFPIAMPGYRPEVVLLVTADESFLLVRETLERGARGNSTYIYRWNGGVQPYLNMLGQARIARLVEQPALPPPAAAPRELPQANRGLPAAAFRPALEDRKARIAALPMAPSSVRDGVSPLQKLLNIGFTRHADDNGPALIATAADGTEFHVSAMPGLRLIDGNIFCLKISEGDDDERLAGVSVEEIQARFADCSPQPGVR
ncbi:hypothetical protein ACVIGB_000969 [Bradyrhizobium sp. USDA 4341]